MKTNTLSALFLAALMLASVGCSKSNAPDAAQPLQESFKTAEPEVQKAVQQVTTHLQAGQYAEATRVLAPVISGRPLTDPQRQAVGTALNQINQSVAANPQLDTKEMYELRKKMFEAVHRGSRF